MSRLQAADWSRARLKHVLAERDERTPNGSESLLALSKSRGLRPYDEIHDREPLADSLEGYKRVFVGDIVMNKMQAWNGVFGLCEEDGIVSPDYTVLTVRPGADPRFLVYLLATERFASEFFVRSRGMGTAFLRLNTGDLLATPLRLPDSDSQRSIADFLDRETQRIDLAAQHIIQLQSLMNLRMQVQIDNLISGGTEDRATVRLSHLADVRLNDVGKRDCPEEPVPCVDLEDVESFAGRLSAEEGDLVGVPGNRIRFRRGDVLTSKLRPYLGKSFLANFDGAASSEFIVLRPRPGTSPKWLLFVVLSRHFIDHAVMTATGVKMPRTSPEQIGRFRLAVPSLDEQARVAATIDREARRIDEAQTQLTSLLHLLRERRQALISAAVTGQLDEEAMV